MEKNLQNLKAEQTTFTRLRVWFVESSMHVGEVCMDA